jgi:hypothetical protein
MLAQQPSIALQQPRAEQSDDAESMSVKRIVAVLQVVLATRRAAYSEDNLYWYSVARGM